MNNFLMNTVKFLKKTKIKPVYYTPEKVIKQIEIESIIANPPYDGKR